MNKQNQQTTVDNYKEALWNVITMVNHLNKTFTKQDIMRQTEFSERFIRWCLMVSSVGIHPELNPNYVAELYGMDAKTTKDFIGGMTKNKYRTLTELRKAIRDSKAIFDNAINENGYSFKRQIVNQRTYLMKRKEYNNAIEQV